MSPSATPQSDTPLPTAAERSPYVFDITPTILNLLDPGMSADFAEQVLGVRELLLQTKPQGEHGQYLHLPRRARDGSASTSAVYTLDLPDQGRVTGPMTITRLVLTAELRQGHALTQRINLARGAVYYAVNALQPGAHRRDETVTDIRCLALDLDGTPLPDTWPLPPTAVVETSPGRYQVLWCVDGVRVGEYKAVQQFLADYHGGDRAVCNPALVLRLPGTLNGKGAQPHPVSLIDVRERRYTRQDVLDAYPALTARLTPHSAFSPRIRSQGPVGRDRVRRYVATALNSEVDKLAAAPVGGRNARLFRSAAVLGGLIAAGVLDEEVARTALREAARACGLEEGEIETTLASGLKRGRSTPRDLSHLEGRRP